LDSPLEILYEDLGTPLSNFGNGKLICNFPVVVFSKGDDIYKFLFIVDTLVALSKLNKYLSFPGAVTS
jgi:hypothetical protein